MSEELKEFQAAYESGDYTEYYSYLLDYAEAQFNKVQELSDLLTQISYDKAIHESNMHKILKLEEQNKRYRKALKEIATRKMSTFLTTRDMNAYFIKTAVKALEEARDE